MLLALKKVPKKGLEPSRLAAHAPETCASTIPPLGPLASAKLALFFELASISPHFFFVFLFGGWWWGWWLCGMWLCGMWLCGMEENKKSGGGDVRAFALSWDGEWDKT